MTPVIPVRVQQQATADPLPPGCCDYQLALCPHEELRLRIAAEKQKFSEKFQAAAMGRTSNRLTLVTFRQHHRQEARICNRLYELALAQAPVKLELQGFGSFPDHTIFIRVTSKLPVQQLVKNIRSQAQRLLTLNNDNKPHFLLEPHFTIAWRLLPWQYEKAWTEYRERHFSGRFIAGHLLLLRRTADEQRYVPVQQFLFQNLPVETRQGKLFT